MLRKSVDWFLYDNGLRHERVKNAPLSWMSGYRLGHIIECTQRSILVCYMCQVCMKSISDKTLS